MRGAGIGANVHYPPVHLQPYHRRTFGTEPGQCPAAEAAAATALTLPLFPTMGEADVDRVVATLLND
jgi:perosamine synthetase